MTEPPAQTLHLLFVLEHFAPMKGGVETLFSNLCEKLVEKGHRVTVITTLPSTAVKKVEQRGGLTIRRYPFRNRYLFTLSALLPVLIHGRGCDLIHTTSYNAALPAFVGSFLLRKKIIITFHEVWGKLWFELPFLSPFQRWAFRLFEKMLICLPFTRFVGVSASTVAALEKAGVSNRRIELIYNGLDYEQIRSLVPDHQRSRTRADRSMTYLYYGRLGISKGLELLLPAFHRVLGRYPACRLILHVPSEPQFILEFLKKQRRELALQESVSIRPPVGRFEELVKRIHSSDAVLVPSHSEGFCFVAAETCAIGTPLISSGRGALPEVVSGKWIDMEEQSVEGLADAMMQAREGRWKQSEVRTFPLSRTVEEYLRCYSRISS